MPRIEDKMNQYLDAIQMILGGIVEDKGSRINAGANILLSLTPQVPINEIEQEVASMLIDELSGYIDD